MQVSGMPRLTQRQEAIRGAADDTTDTFTGRLLQMHRAHGSLARRFANQRAHAPADGIILEAGA